MVICGGLEILAAGYFLNEFNKDKTEQRERRKRRDSQDSRPHNHSRPPRVEENHYDRPSNAVNHVRPNQNLLQLPPQAPLRPMSAPPENSRPAEWPQQPQHWPQGPPNPQQRPPQQANNPYLQALQHGQRFPGQAAPWQNTSQLQGYHNNPSRPGFLPHANTYHSQPPAPPAPLGPGHLQRPATFQPGLPPPSYHGTNPNPVQQPITKPPTGPLIYIDSKTGQISHNLYPPDHPMARSRGDLSKELWGDDKYMRTMAGDIDTGLAWSERDNSDLAYGKDYSSHRSHGRSSSYERTRRQS